MPTEPGVQQNPNVVSTLNPATQYGLGNSVLNAMTYSPDEPGIEYGDTDVTQRKMAGVAPGGMTEMYVPGVGLTMVPNEQLSDQQATLAWTPGNPVYDNSARFFGTGSTDPSAHHAETFIPGQQYRLIDQVTGDVLGTANDLAGFQQLAAKAGQIAAPSLDNKAVNMTTLQRAASGDNPQWSNQTGFDYVPVNGFNDFLRIAGPLLGSALFPGLGILGGVGGSAAGAAAGSVLSGAVTGQSIGDILKSAVLSGGLTFAGGSLGGSLGGASKTASALTGGGNASNILSGLGTTADGITVLAPTLARAASTALPSLAGGLSSIGNSVSNAAPTTPDPTIVVSGAAPSTYMGGGLSGAASAAALANLPNLTPEQIAQGQQMATDTNEIVVQGAKLQEAATAINAGAGIGALTAMGLSPSQIDVARQLAEQQAAKNDTITVSHDPLPAGDLSGIIAPGALVAGGGLALASGASGATAPAAADPNEIVVQGAGSTGGVNLPVVGGIGAAGAAAAAAGGAGSTAAAAAPKTTLQKITDALTAAGLSSQLIGSLLGGGGGTSLGNFSGALGNGNISSTFHQTLPTTGSRIGGGSDLSARVMPQQDWTKYGMRPGQSFFNNVPQAYTPPLPGQIDQWTHLARGGSVEAPDYDYAGAEKAGVHPDERGHMPDTYKLPNHMTFSDDSVYSTPETQGGKWRQSPDGKWVFWPSEFNMQQHPMAEMQDYFSRVEPDSPAIYPSDFRLEKAKGGAVTGSLAARPHTSFAVNGPGSGRSDHIPAMLSDGEYVMDAETVGLLGDGSNKSGADKLDKFRVNLRKHKGKQLVKGKFSLSAKAPEAYMFGVK